MTKVVVELELFGDYDHDEGPIDIEGAVIREIARQLMPELTSEMLKHIREMVEKEAKAQVNDTVTEAMNTIIVARDMWGNPKGDPISLRDYIAKQASDWLGVKVDRYGEPAGHGSQTRLEHYIEGVIKKDLKKTYDENIKAAIDVAKRELDSKLGERMAQALREVLKIS